MNHTLLNEEHAILAQTFFDEGRNEKYVSEYLEKNQFDPRTASAIHHRFKALCYEKRKKIGMLLLGLGAILCIAGFMFTLLLSHEHASFNFALYGMTSAGATGLMAGLACIIG